MSLTMIAAVARGGVIGRDNDMPWHLPADLKHFKALTMGKTMLMGRRTYLSIGRPLPGRTTLVLTRQTDWTADGVTVVHSVPEALALVGDAELIIAGGGDLYAQLIDTADRLEITHIDQNVLGDTMFPKIDPEIWGELAREDHDGYSFVTYQRR